MKRFLSFCLCVTCLIATVCLGGCKKDVLRVNEVTHSVFYAPLYYADGKGYLQDEGITMQLTNGGGADNTMAALLSGSADIAFCGPEAGIYVLNGQSNDAPKVFAQLTKRDGSFLLSRNDEPFEWNMLEGKEILAGRRGGVPAMTFAYTLHQKGINATLNYDVAFNMMASAFEGGIADYCTMFEPTASTFEDAGKGKIVASVGEASGEIPYTCFMAKGSYIKKHPDKIEGFTRALTKAIKDIYEGNPNDIVDVIAPYFDGTTKDQLKKALQNYIAIDAWVKNMAMKPEALDNLQDVMAYAGELQKRVIFGDLVVTEPANTIYTRLYA